MGGQILFLDEKRMGIFSDGKCRMLTSRREEEYRDTLRELERKNEWKTTGTGAKFMKQHNPYAGASEWAHCSIPALAGVNGQILYAMITREAGRLYVKDASDDEAMEGYRYGEKNFWVTDMDAVGDRIACAANDVQGEYHIAMLEEGRPGYRWLTSGDTVDAAPWISRLENVLYYASAGLARDEEGSVLAKGPSSVQKLSLSCGTLEEICAADDTDYLRPKEGPDGALYMIVRPYKQPARRRPTVAERVKNTGNFFKAMGALAKVITGTADADQMLKQQANGNSGTAVQTRTLNGWRVEITAGQDASEEQGWAPDSWVLMRRGSDGTLTEVRRGVADYAFDGERLIYTDGRRIYAMEDGKRVLLHKGAFISRLAVMQQEN